MIVQAKMKCLSRTECDGGAHIYKFCAVMGEENKPWSRYTPSANFDIQIDSTLTQASFRVGECYMFDMSPMPGPEPTAG